MAVGGVVVAVGGVLFVVAVVAVPCAPLPWYGFHDDGGIELMSSACSCFGCSWRSERKEGEEWSVCKKGVG